MRVLTIAAGCVLVLLLAFAGAACGDDDSETAGDTDTVTLETTTDDTTTDNETDVDTTEDTDTVGDSIESEECQDLIEASASLSQALGAAGTDSDLDDVSTFFEEFAEEAPDEIREDFQVLAEAYEAYAEAIEGIDLQSGQTPDPEALQQLQEALASIDQEEVAAASERISAWTNDNC